MSVNITGLKFLNNDTMGRAMLQRAMILAYMERDLARERTLAGRRDPEHAVARWTFVGPRRHDNRVALQRRPPDLHLESRRDSAAGLLGRDNQPTGGHGRIWPATRCLRNNG